MTAVVLEFRPAPAATARQLEIQLNRAHMQLDALISHVVNEALVAWIGAHETPLTDDEIAAQREYYLRHYTGICLNATAHKRGPAQ